MSSDELPSQESLDLQLSQDTLNQVMSAVGVDGNNLTETFQANLDDEGDQESSSGSSISISRTVIQASSILPPWGGLSQSCEFGSQPPLSFPSHTLPATAKQLQRTTTAPLSPRYNSVSPQAPTPVSPIYSSEAESPFTSSANPILPPPLSLSQGSQYELSRSNSSTQQIRTNIPSNVPIQGEYEFQLFFENQEKKAMSKNANFTFSSIVDRAYIKRAAVIPFTFKLKSPPPLHSLIRAMCIHKAPEMIGQNLTCCPKHVDVQRKERVLYPYHFVHPQPKDKESAFCEDSWKRPSITTPFAALQKKPGNVYTTLYLFPCFTSDFSRSGQMVQVIFTLECGSEVLGRAVSDIRVCASPGRDREVDEKKVTGRSESVSPKAEQGGPLPTTRKGRKRGAAASSNQADVIQCTLPPKQVCLGLSGDKVDYTIRTWPQLIPFIDVCVKMMEQVHSVPVDVATNSTSAQQEPSLSSVESWLEHLGLSRYLRMLRDHGVSQLFQISGITEDELKSWGMRNSTHRKKFIEGKNQIVSSDGSTNHDQDDMEIPAAGSPPLFPSQSPPPLSQAQPSHPHPLQPHPSQPHPSQAPPPPRLTHMLTHSSQQSLSSTQPFSTSMTTFEMLQIQMTKKLGDSFSSQNKS